MWIPLDLEQRCEPSEPIFDSFRFPDLPCGSYGLSEFIHLFSNASQKISRFLLAVIILTIIF